MFFSMLQVQTFLSQTSEASSARLSEIAFSLQIATSSKCSAARFFHFKPTAFIPFTHFQRGFAGL